MSKLAAVINYSENRLVEKQLREMEMGNSICCHNLTAFIGNAAFIVYRCDYLRPLVTVVRGSCSWGNHWEQILLFFISWLTLKWGRWKLQQVCFEALYLRDQMFFFGDSVKCSRVDLAGCSCLTGAHQRQATLAQQRTSAWLMSPGRESYWSESLKPVERSHRWEEGWSPLGSAGCASSPGCIPEPVLLGWLWFW